jgi:DNA topoisomerase IA
MMKTATAGVQRFTPTNLGMALVKGYQSMQLDAILKPNLRAQVESDLTAICERLVV